VSITALYLSAKVALFKVADFFTCFYQFIGI